MLRNTREFCPFQDHCLCTTHPWVPGEELYKVQDGFTRDIIHPAVKEYMSPAELYFIETFNYFNAVFLLPLFDVFQWIGLWNILDYHFIWTDDPRTQILVYMGIGWTFLAITLLINKANDGSVDMEDSWRFGIPRSFGLRRKTKNFLRVSIGFIGYVFFWVGAGSQWDMEQEIFQIYIMYAVVSIVVLYLSTEVFSIDSMFQIIPSMVIKYRELSGSNEGYSLAELDDEEDAVVQ